MKPVVIVPTYAHIEPECEAGLAALERGGIPIWRRFGCSAIDKARSVLASEALARGFDRMLWIDSDIAFRVHDALALLEAPHTFCCAAYVLKRPLGGFALSVDKQDGLRFGAGGGWLEARACGFGFVAVSAEVFRALDAVVPEAFDDVGKRHRPYFMPLCAELEPAPGAPKAPAVLPQYHSEDYSFCRRARDAGFKLWCDTRIRLYHIGRYLFSWEDAAFAIPRHASVIVNSAPT